jgi:hypothetical protein
VTASSNGVPPRRRGASLSAPGVQQRVEDFDVVAPR